jgi:Family of unknown function (DUF6527)
MSKITQISYAFVDSAPETLQPGTVYISTKYRAIVHLCLCGCGEKVLLNLDPDSWSFTFDGRSISIHDSVGNVGLPCRSHYIVRRNRVEWLPPLVGIDPNIALALRPHHEKHQEVSKPRGLARWIPWRRRKSGKG